MSNSLNVNTIKSSMERAGLSQTRLAGLLVVTKEFVSKWLQGKIFPRPDKLLKLSITLDLNFDDLVLNKDEDSEPVVAFRKKGNWKTTELHIDRAKDMGRMLSALVPYLPFDLLVQPPILKKPLQEYNYIQEVAQKVRTEIGVYQDEELTFAHLIKKFRELQAVIIPVLWGKKDNHENALHIYLPESMTTWIYLNLDVEIPDFKFWMAHEISHVYTPELRGEEAECFADSLAGALLFPESIAKDAYSNVINLRSDRKRISMIRDYADRYTISLISVCYEINNFATFHGLPTIEMKGSYYGANTNFNKKYKSLSSALFDDGRPDANSYIHAAREEFQTPFFDALKEYLLENGKTEGYIQSVLNIPLLDAKGVFAELS